MEEASSCIDTVASAYDAVPFCYLVEEGSSVVPEWWYTLHTTVSNKIDAVTFLATVNNETAALVKIGEGAYVSKECSVVSVAKGENFWASAVDSSVVGDAAASAIFTDEVVFKGWSTSF